MWNDTNVIEDAMCSELKELQDAEQALCAAFEKLPAELALAESISRFLYCLAETDKRLDNLELLLDIMESTSLEAGTAAA